MKDQIQKRAEEIGKEAAFPCTSDQYALGERGVNKLQYFAGLAFRGLLSNNKYNDGDYFDGEALASDSLTCAKAICIAISAAELEGGQNG